MKSFVFCVLLLCLMALGNGAILQRRLREGNNSINRRLRSCTLICTVKNTLRVQGNPQKCYRLQTPNITVSECVYNCLRFKREQLQNAIQCECVNGVCIDQKPSTPSQLNTGTQDNTTAVSNGATNLTTNDAATPTTNGFTNPSTNPTNTGTTSTTPTPNGSNSQTTNGTNNPTNSADEDENTGEEFATTLQRSTEETGGTLTAATTAATSVPTTELSEDEEEIDKSTI